MTLTLTSVQFSPRIIVSFARDRVTQWTLGIFLGTFSYCMAALPAARSVPYPFAPVGTVVGAMALALACVGWLLFFIHHISQAISVNHIVDRIASETEVVINDIMPSSHAHSRLKGAEPIDPNTWEMTLLNDVSGYIRFIDTKRLVALAKSYRVKIHILRRVGQFVPSVVPLLIVYKGERLSPEGIAELRAALEMGPSNARKKSAAGPFIQTPVWAVGLPNGMCQAASNPRKWSSRTRSTWRSVARSRATHQA